LEQQRKSAVELGEQQERSMGPGYFVIAILGCADSGSACTQVTTLQTRYESEAQCSAATAASLERNNNFDYPMLVARCRANKTPAAADAQRPKLVRAEAQRG
jgi:hypothetical protein